jgi:hypothetical protein
MKEIKKYKLNLNLSAYIMIPFSSGPLLTSLIILDKTITGLAPSLLVVFTARFLDNAIAILNGIPDKDK